MIDPEWQAMEFGLLSQIIKSHKRILHKKNQICKYSQEAVRKTNWKEAAKSSRAVTEEETRERWQVEQ